jgi:Peptidase family M28
MRFTTRLALAAALSLLAQVTWASPYTPRCGGEDRTLLAVRSVRALVAERCECGSASSHARYVRCAKREVTALARDGRLARACRRVVVGFERASTCGSRSTAVCCRSTRTGAVKASITTASRCARRGGVTCACDAAASSTCAHSVFDACTVDATCADGPDGEGPADVHAHLLPSTGQMLQWIRDIVALGVRRPGYEADDQTEQWAVDRFNDLGLENVHLDPIDVQRWESQSCALWVWPAGRRAERGEILCFPVPFSTPTASLTGALAPLVNGGGVAGRIAVVDNTFLALPQVVALAFSTDHYDPTGEFATHVQTLPFSGEFQNVMEPAIAAGATGFVGIIDGLPWETDQYFVPYDAHQRPIPGIWLSPANGARLKGMLAAGPVEGEIVVGAELRPAVSHNVIGTLPGASSEWVIIGSHHDGPWASAVEDASGTALVLGQALYWSQVPAAERPHNLLFLLNGGHMSGGAGLIAFVERNPDLLRQVVLELHLEHVAREARGEGGRLVPTDRPEVRWWFTSRIPALQAAVKEAIVSEDLDRSIIMAPDGFPPGSAAPPTDGAFFHPAGVPIVNLLAAPMYLFDAADTIEMIHEASLVPVSRAAARLVSWTRGQTAAGMRAAVTR